MPQIPPPQISPRSPLTLLTPGPPAPPGLLVPLSITGIMIFCISLHIELVDSVLEEQDLNHDGFLDYYEYIMAKEKSRVEAEKHEKENQKKSDERK